MRLAVDTSAYRAISDGLPVFVDAIQRAEVVAFSVIVLGELRAGFAHGSRRTQNERSLRRALATHRALVHEVTETTSNLYGRVWSDLRKRGRPIPTNDMWIAAQCIERDFALLTPDGHFKEIPDLRTFP